MNGSKNSGRLPHAEADTDRRTSSLGPSCPGGRFRDVRLRRGATPSCPGTRQQLMTRCDPLAAASGRSRGHHCTSKGVAK
ncbi:hypothetical protein E2C01_013743 [Portunus trituberculatus]|uniref:Uncharacterized protein n=1 Tax=Portunus trituberculatus TaxID=210409 RepID=A0A5B7DHW4_PORTR|nr:hypothetical protein [Portunus trituberculatus]